MNAHESTTGPHPVSQGTGVATNTSTPNKTGDQNPRPRRQSVEDVILEILRNSAKKGGAELTDTVVASRIAEAEELVAKREAKQIIAKAINYAEGIAKDKKFQGFHLLRELGIKIPSTTDNTGKATRKPKAGSNKNAASSAKTGTGISNIPDGTRGQTVERAVVLVLDGPGVTGLERLIDELAPLSVRLQQSLELLAFSSALSVDEKDMKWCAGLGIESGKGSLGRVINGKNLAAAGVDLSTAKTWHERVELCAWNAFASRKEAAKELLEWQTLEVMRQPLEDGHVTISRAAGSLTFPARFMLVAAMNPCPCGFYGDVKRQCRCSVRQIENYRQRISGPLLDRIDIHVEVPLVDFKELSTDSVSGESSGLIRERVAEARRIQVERFKSSKPTTTNAAMGAKEVRSHCALDAESKGYLEHAMEQMNFSARAHDRILKVSRTLADLAGKEKITGNEVLEAIQFRSLDRQLFE
eukprot:g3476.t1